MAGWWRKLLAPLDEPPSRRRQVYRCFLVLFGCTALLLVIAVATGNDTVFGVTGWVYAACGGCLAVFAWMEAGDSRRAWAEASQPSFEFAAVEGDPDVVVRRRPLGARIVFVALGGAFALLAVNIAVDASASASAVWLLFSMLVLGLGGYTASFALSTLVVRRDLVAVRSNLAWKTAAWDQIRAVEPTHDGMVFELVDGRRLVAIATAKTSLVFLPVRYDKALLDDLRSRIR